MLSYVELLELVRGGVVCNSDESLVNSASIDVRLGDKVLRPDYAQPGVENKTLLLSLRDRTPMPTVEVNIADTGYILYPGEFCLASTLEVFNLPLNLSCEFHLKSSAGRIGLNHVLAGWCDAGWNNSALTVELFNVGQFPILLHKGVAFGQMVFTEHTPVPAEKSYAVRGRYNNDSEVEGIKP